MKKIFAAVITAALLALGFVATTGGQASAACPYSACLPSSSTAKAPAAVKVGAKAKLKFVASASGNVKPVGTVTFKVKKKGGGFSFSKTKSYTGGTLTVKTPKLGKKGKYTVKTTFTPTANSIFNASSDSDSFKVK